MTSTGNINIFEGAPARFIEALPLFSGLPGTVLPVRRETAGAARLFTLADISEGGRPALPAFTSEELLLPPLIRQGLAETAALFFHAPSHDTFVFNPAHPQARAAAAPLKASRLEISLLAGFAKVAGLARSGDTERLAEGELAAGNLHSAHYLYALAASRNPASRVKFPLCAAMLELGLVQEAYDLLKFDADKEARLLLAVIYRKTGHAAEAGKTLSELGTGTPLEDRRAAENAWLDLETGKEDDARKAFQRLSSSAFDKTEALSGLGAALAKAAFRTKDRNGLAAAAAALRSALGTPSPASGRIFFQLGNLYFRSGDLAQAEDCYRRSAGLAPAIQALANLALTLIKTGKHEEAAAITAQVALTDILSARRLVAEFPKEKLPGLFPPAAPEPEPAPQPGKPPAQDKTPGPDSAASGLQFIKPAVPAEETSLAPARPRDASVSGRSRPQQPAQQEAKPLEIETMRDVMAGAEIPTEEESRKDDFISRAFRLASELEDELGRKVYFNADGLSEVERRLRLQFIKTGTNQQGKMETIRDCAAFLTYMLQERNKGRLIKMADFDPWGWPMVFELPGQKLTTYPIQRAWRLLWEETVPEPGWLSKYTAWVADRLKETAPPVCGAAAAKSGVMSHPERLTDARTEHRRMMVLISSLNETSHIELGISGLVKLDNAIKSDFRPNIPPTADGWKMLRCYGHLLAEILIKDFKAVWYNTDGEDGGWSMRMPWKTIIFPIGKVYKTASHRDSLAEYYEVLMNENFRIHGPTPG